MPWQETDIIEQRGHFITAWLTKRYSVASLCQSFQISRKTGHRIMRFSDVWLRAWATRKRISNGQIVNVLRTM